MTARRALWMIAAGARMRCPRCGRGRLFAHALTLRMHRACPVCAWTFEREEGYWTGAVAIDMVLTELLVSAIALGLVLLTSTPALLVLAVGLPAAILFPILCYPFAKSFWMRFDLLTNPPEPEAGRAAG
jgi:uncharacterized protein (DUF983 family)